MLNRQDLQRQIIVVFFSRFEFTKILLFLSQLPQSMNFLKIIDNIAKQIKQISYFSIRFAPRDALAVWPIWR